MNTLEPIDLLGNYDLKIDIKNSEPACMMCLPPKALDGHKSLYGVLIHERIDCEPNVIYGVNESKIVDSLSQEKGK